MEQSSPQKHVRKLRAVFKALVIDSELVLEFLHGPVLLWGVAAPKQVAHDSWVHDTPKMTTNEREKERFRE